MENIISELFNIQNNIIKNISLDFKRSLYKDINWNARMITITGARGTGKTTMVLQHYIEKYNNIKKCLYFSADNPLILKNGIYNTVKEYFKYYGECVIIDEIHKQNNWSEEIKALYDSYPDKKFIILGSSKIDILNAKGDLSRRTLIYNLKSLSFREFLILKHNKKIEKISLEKIIENHETISLELKNKIPNILGEFKEYLKQGAYPFFYNYSYPEYKSILNNVIDKIIYEDLSSIKNIKYSSINSIKKLIAFLTTSKIPTINVSSTCKEIGVSKETLYEFLDLLERADLIHIIREDNSKSRSIKNSKILFYNPNLYYSLAEEMWNSSADLGNIRESFFVSQIKNIEKIQASKIVDFTVNYDGKIIECEIGGKNKSRKQIKNIDNGYIFRDDQINGFGNIIPLYLIGFIQW